VVVEPLLLLPLLPPACGHLPGSAVLAMLGAALLATFPPLVD
jgi:hypothetical protein